MNSEDSRRALPSCLLARSRPRQGSARRKELEADTGGGVGRQEADPHALTDREAVTGMRGVDPLKVYQRPGMTTWTALYKIGRGDV